MTKGNARWTPNPRLNGAWYRIVLLDDPRHRQIWRSIDQRYSVRNPETRLGPCDYYLVPFPNSLQSTSEASIKLTHLSVTSMVSRKVVSA